MRGVNLSDEAKLQRQEWTPAALRTSPIIMWLDANDISTISSTATGVSAWQDKSGFNRHVTQATNSNQPTYTRYGSTNRPALNFDGTDWLAVSGITINHDAGSIFSVFTMEPTVNHYEQIIGTFANLTTTRTIVRRSASNNAIEFVANTSGIIRVYTLTTTNQNAGYLWESSGVNAAYENGSLRSSGSNTVTTGTDTNSRINVGGVSNYLVGSISEIVYCGSSLNTMNRQKVEGYLAWKWGLRASLPPTHPYVNYPPLTRG